MDHMKEIQGPAAGVWQLKLEMCVKKFQKKKKKVEGPERRSHRSYHGKPWFGC